MKISEAELCELEENEIVDLYKAYYKDSAFVSVVDSNPDLKMVVSQLAYWGNGNEWLFQEAQDAFAASEPNAEIAVIKMIDYVKPAADKKDEK